MPSLELIGIVGPAIAAGLMIALAHGLLGVEVLRRGIIFIDLAIAQIAGLGLVIANLYLFEPSWWILQGAALLFAMLAGLFFRLVETKMPRQQEAIIGSSFIVAASLALLLLADSPHGGDEIRHLLSGQILFITWTDVGLFAPIYIAIVILWLAIPALRKGLWFYLLFAFAITSSVQLVGVYVVFASLILPALAAVDASRPHMWAWICGTLAVISGIILSAYADLPAGPFLVLTYTVTCLLILMGRRIANNVNS